MQLIGTVEINKKSKNGKMLLAVPFWNTVDFFVSSNLEKKGESSPDFLIWNKKIKIGGLWKQTSEKNGTTKNYFSGSIFAPILGENNKLRIVIFEDEKNQNLEIYLGNVFFSFSDKSKNTIDRELEPIENSEDEIF